MPYLWQLKVSHTKRAISIWKSYLIWKQYRWCGKNVNNVQAGPFIYFFLCEIWAPLNLHLLFDLALNSVIAESLHSGATAQHNHFTICFNYSLYCRLWKFSFIVSESHGKVRELDIWLRMRTPYLLNMKHIWHLICCKDCSLLSTCSLFCICCFSILTDWLLCVKFVVTCKRNRLVIFIWTNRMLTVLRVRCY